MDCRIDFIRRPLLIYILRLFSLPMTYNMEDIFFLHTPPDAYDTYAAPAVGSYSLILACVNANANTGFLTVWLPMTMVCFHS